MELDCAFEQQVIVMYKSRVNAHTRSYVQMTGGYASSLDLDKVRVEHPAPVNPTESTWIELADSSDAITILPEGGMRFRMPSTSNPTEAGEYHITLSFCSDDSCARVELLYVRSN